MADAVLLMSENFRSAQLKPVLGVGEAGLDLKRGRFISGKEEGGQLGHDTSAYLPSYPAATSPTI